MSVLKKLGIYRFHVKGQPALSYDRMYLGQEEVDHAMCYKVCRLNGNIAPALDMDSIAKITPLEGVAKPLKAKKKR